MTSKVDEKVWEVQMYFVNHYNATLDQSSVYVNPLAWWIYTGRASAPMLKAFLNAKTFMIARRLYGPGSHDECLKRVTDYLEMNLKAE